MPQSETPQQIIERLLKERGIAMQYAVQQTATLPWIDERGNRRVNRRVTRLVAFNREHAEAMADALTDISGNGKEYRDAPRHMDEYHARDVLPVTYHYEVVAMVRNAQGQAVWMDISELQMIASMFNANK